MIKKISKWCTWLIWYFQQLLWSSAVKRYLTVTPKYFEDAVALFCSTIGGIRVLGTMALTDFDQEVHDRLVLILYWLCLSLDVKLEISWNITADDLVTQINEHNSQYFPLLFRKNENACCYFEYCRGENEWCTPKYRCGSVWSTTISQKNRELAYLVNAVIYLGRKERGGV